MLHTLALTVPVLALAAVAVPAPGCPATVARATALRPILPEAFGAALTAAADECRLDLAGDITLFAPSNTDESVGHYITKGILSVITDFDRAADTLEGSAELWTEVLAGDENDDSEYSKEFVAIDQHTWVVTNVLSGDGYIVYLLGHAQDHRDASDGDGDDIDVDTDTLPDTQFLPGGISGGGGGGGGGRGGGSSSGGGGGGRTSSSGSKSGGSSGSSSNRNRPNTAAGAGVVAGGVVGAGAGYGAGRMGGDGDGNGSGPNATRANPSVTTTYASANYNTAARMGVSWALPVAVLGSFGVLAL